MEKADVVLAEYKALRDAVLNNFRLQLQVYAVYASGLLVFYGLIFRHGVYDLIMTIPIFSLALLFRILWQEIIIRWVSEYILEIEKKKIPILVGTMKHVKEDEEVRSTNLCIGWQHFWKEKGKEEGWPKYYEYSRIMLFVVFSVVPAVLYNIYNLIAPSLGIQPVTKLSIFILILVLIVNFSLGCYMWYKIKQIDIYPNRLRMLHKLWSYLWKK